jgi:hypothetical protein
MHSGETMRAILLASMLAAAAMPASALAQQFDPELPIVCQPETPNIPSTLPPHIAERLRQKEQARINSRKQFCEEERRKLAERREKERQAAAARQKAQEEMQRKLIEQKRRDEEERRIKEAEMRKPINQLRLAYYRYLYVRRCYRAREGYVVVWVNDVELQRARDAITRLEKLLLNQDQTLDTASEWEEISKKMPSIVYEYQCQQNYQDLMLSSPAVPERKDFGQ